jgi:hypothetical protein
MENAAIMSPMFPPILGGVLTWDEFHQARPDLAEAGQGLLYQFGGVALAFLATVRRDGGPRVHPICPVIVNGGLLAFILPSPKRKDLTREGRYALHTFPSPVNEDAFYLTGRAQGRLDRALRASVDEVYLSERHWEDAPPGHEEEDLFEFQIEACLLTRTTGHGDYHPQHSIWAADSHDGSNVHRTDH